MSDNNDSVNDVLARNVLSEARRERQEIEQRHKDLMEQLKQELKSARQDEDIAQDLARDILEARERDQQEFRRILKGRIDFGWERE